MCHQTVGLVAGEIEKRGIATTSLTMLREVTEKVRPPRSLAVDYPLGYPLGRAGDSALQTAILRAALGLLGHPGPPPVLIDFAALPSAAAS
jgi:D-proline reductase (dithiol) PrdB